jgi:hypothetical protein
MRLLLHRISVLVDGAGYGDDRSAYDSPTGTGFPQGVLASFPWEGWWHDAPEEDPALGDR